MVRCLFYIILCFGSLCYGDNWNQKLNRIVSNLNNNTEANDTVKLNKNNWYYKSTLNAGEYVQLYNILKSKFGNGIELDRETFQWNAGSNITFILGPTENLVKLNSRDLNPELEVINRIDKRDNEGTIIIVNRSIDRIALVASRPRETIRVPIESTQPETEIAKGTSTGTGFFVSTSGDILTSYHVVRGKEKITVRVNERNVPAKLIDFNSTTDLALLRINMTSPALPVINLSQLKMGDDVYTIGFPNLEIQGVSQKLTKGHINSLTGMRDNPNFLQMSVPIQPGNSGGPLLNEKGQVVGVIAARLNDMTTYRNTGVMPQNVNYAVRSDKIIQFLNKNNISSGNRQLGVNEVSNSVVLVVGF